MTSKLAAATVAALLATAAPVWAHHAFAAEFDAKKPVHLDGTLTKVELINPHAWIHVDVKDPDGKVTNWMVEAGSPNVLLRRGFNKNTIGNPRHRGRLSVQRRIQPRQRPGHHAP